MAIGSAPAGLSHRPDGEDRVDGSFNALRPRRGVCRLVIPARACAFPCRHGSFILPEARRIHTIKGAAALRRQAMA